MARYQRSELHSKLKACNLQEMCTEIYDALDKTGLTPLHSGDKFAMSKLKYCAFRLEASKRFCTIVIIHNDIPCLVVHRKDETREDPTPEDPHSISDLYFIFQGEEINQVLYKTLSIREILELLCEPDSKTHEVVNSRTFLGSNKRY